MNGLKKKMSAIIMLTVLIVMCINTTVYAGSSCPNCMLPAVSTYNNPEPTCTQNGVEECKCSSCGYLLYIKAIPKLGHSFNVASANCTTDKYCTRCDYLEAGKLGHGWVHNSNGYWECFRCGTTRPF